MCRLYHIQETHTHELEKDVIEAATVGDPNIIPGLLEQYKQETLRLFEVGGS